MLDIFSELEPLHYSHFELSYFKFIKDSYNAELNKVVKYYHERIDSVPQNHILVRCLNLIDAPLEYPIENFYNAVSARSEYVARALNLTTETNYGKIHKGIFFGNNSSEIIIATDEYFSLDRAERDWKYLSPVRVLLHPKTDMQLIPPYGIDSSANYGLSVIAINIPILNIQYRAYINSLRSTSIDGDFLGTQYFIHRYVIPNMLYSMIDLTVFNRYRILFEKKEMGRMFERNPFPIHPYENKLDSILNKYLEIAPNRTFFYEQYLLTFPSIHSSSIYRSLLLPNLTKTRQVYWALMLSRLEIMETIIMSLGVKSLVANKMHLVHLKRKLIRLNIEKIYQQILPNDLYKDTQERISRILSL